MSMAADPTNMMIHVTAVIVAVTDNTPRVLIVNKSAEQSDSIGPGLPSGPFDPAHDDSLEIGLRRLVEAQTGLDLYYVEQLYTFGNRFRELSEIEGGPRIVSVAYIALTHEDIVSAPNAEWHDWYNFLPWEDWRNRRPEILESNIEPELSDWIKRSQGQGKRGQRQDRVNVTFGSGPTSGMDSVLSLERFELLYDAGLVSEAERDKGTLHTIAPGMGDPLISDHRRILATALGRLRGKLAYRPVVFELLPGEFTLLQLQRVAEALSGAKLHKQNFRRLVTNADLVEPIGRTMAVGRGRPAELFRFRREVLGEKLTVGLSRPIMRRHDA